MGTPSRKAALTESKGRSSLPLHIHETPIRSSNGLNTSADFIFISPVS